MKSLALIVLSLVFYAVSIGAPRVAVFPFEPLMDSTYNIWRDQVKVLDYQLALQSFLVSDLISRDDMEAVKIDKPVKSVSEAVAAAKAVNADFAVIGSYAELPTAIRGDAQLIDVALGDVPRGYQASATASNWEDLSAVADELANQLIGLIKSSSTARIEPRSRLAVEGDRDALGFPPSAQAHLLIEVNSPAPKISLSDGSTMKRCSVKDRSLAAGTQPSQICYSADVRAGEIVITIDQRGYYGHKETVSLTEGKVYRLIVELEKMSFQSVPTPK